MSRVVRPALVLAAHGTRSAAGEAALAGLAALVARQRPWCRVQLAYLEISRPRLADVLPEMAGAAVVVPLLLAGGYHIRHDIPGIVAGTGAVVARHLGPDPLLTSALARRLGALRPADSVILGAAGSSDPGALAEVRASARMLAVRLARPVTAAFASAGTPTLDEAMERARSGSAPRVVIASYLLAPGYFHDRLEATGADLVSPPLGPDPALAGLVWHRYDESLGNRSAA